MGRRFPILGFGMWTVLTATGCRKSADDDKYLVVSAVHYMKKYPASPDEEEEIRFTLNHGRSTKIVAHCQAWDIENNCKLEVGKEYDLVRESGSVDMLCLYDPQDRNQPRHAQTVLVVEEESRR